MDYQLPNDSSTMDFAWTAHLPINKVAYIYGKILDVVLQYTSLGGIVCYCEAMWFTVVVSLTMLVSEEHFSACTFTYLQNHRSHPLCERLFIELAMMVQIILLLTGIQINYQFRQAVLWLMRN